MTNESIQLFLVRFQNEIAFREVPLLRGAILNAVGNDVLKRVA